MVLTTGQIDAGQENRKPVGQEQVRKWREVLERYRASRKKLEDRVISAENWWKMRNSFEGRKDSEIGKDGGFTSRSAWLHNVIVSKHADAMDAFPEPNILPREQGDEPEAKKLRSIIPCVLERNGFEEVYDDVQSAKMKFGTGVYKVYWDKNLLNGLGDIHVEEISILNMYWEPEISDIQDSKYLFQTQTVDMETLMEAYPELRDTLTADRSFQAEFQTDEKDTRASKCLVVEVYYHKTGPNGKRILHYCKFAGETVLFATENDTDAGVGPDGMPLRVPMSQCGLYDHGMYPFVFDTLYKVERSPAGYGYVDICRNPQERLDLLDTAFTKNAVVNAIPRYFSRIDGNINEDEFLDTSKPIVHVQGGVDDNSLRQIVTTPLQANNLNYAERVVSELRETSGNTDTSTGNVPSGVTAASAIAALQEASGKGSRDSTMGAYRAFSKVVNICIELVRQFYDLPRQFRIVGEYGANEYISYSNQGIKPQQQMDAFGNSMGLRLPVFDIKVSAQKASTYTKVAQNELAIQFYQLGFFNPQLAEQSLLCLQMMDFDNKDKIMQGIQKNSMMQQKLLYYMQAAALTSVDPNVQAQAAMELQSMGGAMQVTAGSAEEKAGNSHGMGKAPKNVETARQRAGSASQPGGTGL